MADPCINSNPDIAGIGIRVNFYTTIFVAILTLEKSYTNELLCGIYKNSVISGLGILFTAVIQTVQGKLDIYHAIVVMYILFFFNVVFLFGERKFVWSSQDNFQIFIYLLLHAFGVTVFFIWFLATVTWFRILMIVFFSGAIPFFMLILFFLILAPVTWTKACTDRLQKLFDSNRRLWLVRYVIGIPLAVYIIANLELIVSRNRSIIQPGENEWGFGQIIAVVLTLGMFIDMAAAFREWRKPEAQTTPEVPKTEARATTPEAQTPG